MLLPDLSEHNGLRVLKLHIKINFPSRKVLSVEHLVIEPR